MLGHHTRCGQAVHVLDRPHLSRAEPTPATTECDVPIPEMIRPRRCSASESADIACVYLWTYQARTSNSRARSDPTSRAPRQGAGIGRRPARNTRTRSDMVCTSPPRVTIVNLAGDRVLMVSLLVRAFGFLVLLFALAALGFAVAVGGLADSGIVFKT